MPHSRKHQASSMSPLISTLVVLAIGLLGYVCRVAYTKLMTTHLSLSLYGDFTVAWSSLSLVASIITLGSTLTTQRFVSLYQSTNQQTKKQDFIHWSYQLLLRSSAILLVIYILFWITASVTHLSNFHSFDKYHLALFVMIFAPIISISMILNSLVLSYGYALLTTTLGNLINRLVQLCVFGICFYFFIPESIYHLSVMIFIALLVTTLVSAVITLWLPDNEIANALLHQRKRFVDTEWLAVSKASCINTIMYLLTATADLYILEIFSPQEHHVGIFSICCLCVGLPNVLIRSISTQLTTQIMNTDQLDVKGRRRLQSALDIYNLAKITLIVISMLCSWYYRAEIFHFFNVTSTTGYALLPLMLFNVYLLDTRYTFSYLAANHEMKFLNKIQGISLSLMIILQLILVVPYDMYGIAIATCLSRIFTKAVLNYRCRQLSSIRFNLYA